MISAASNTRIWLMAGATDIRRGFDGLSAQVQTTLAADPFICVGRDYVAAALHRACFRGEGRLGRHITS